MSEVPAEPQPGLTAAHRATDVATVAPPVPAALLTDDEMRRTFRIAEALHLSGAFSAIKNPEQAFAKMIIGRDLGLSPAQAMQGIHLVEGGIQMHYAMLGQFIRSRPGYDYRAGWLKSQKMARVLEQGHEPANLPVVSEEEGSVYVRTPDGEVMGVIGVHVWDEIVTVWHDAEEPEDNREIVGAVVDFTVNGARRGLSRFTIEDARTAGLIKPDKPKSAWMTSRRNMYLARCMSNGVKWYVPEVLGGLPVYVEGELEKPRIELTAASGEPVDDEGTGVDLGPKVEALIERATTLGHRGLSNRTTVELAVGQRAPGIVNDWVVRAKEELDRFEAAKRTGAAGPDAPQEEPVAEDVSGEVVAEPEAAREGVEDSRRPGGQVDDPTARLRAAVEDEGGEVTS